MSIKKAYAPLWLTFCSMVFFASPIKADSLNAQCYLEILGEIKFNAPCSFNLDEINEIDGTHFFSDLRMVLVCPNGLRVGITNCYSPEYITQRSGTFGYFFRRVEGTADVCWNEGYMHRADPCFRDLTYDGSCWSSPNANSNYPQLNNADVKFCVWGLQPIIFPTTIQ